MTIPAAPCDPRLVCMGRSVHISCGLYIEYLDNIRPLKSLFLKTLSFIQIHILSSIELLTQNSAFLQKFKMSLDVLHVL